MARSAAVFIACTAVSIVLPCAPAAAQSDACAEIRLREQQSMELYQRHGDRHHLEAAQTYHHYARQCRSGTGTAGAPSAGNRRAEQLGRMNDFLGAVADMVRDARRRENYQQAFDDNELGKRLSAAGDHAGAVAAFNRALDHLRENGDSANMDVVDRNRDQALARLRESRERDNRENARLASGRSAAEGIRAMASAYGAKPAGEFDCTPAHFDPDVCNFGDRDPIWKNLRAGVRPSWCVQNGGTWNGLAQLCAISPERAAAAPPPEPPEPGKRYYLVNPVEQNNPFLQSKPVVREQCGAHTCMYRNIELADCRRLGGIAYARRADGAYSGSCAIHAFGGTPANIDQHFAPVYTGQGSAALPLQQVYPTEQNPWGDPSGSGVSERGAGGGRGGRNSGDAR